jgi:NitT/TauT family transport system ATP-binding protein
MAVEYAVGETILSIEDVSVSYDRPILRGVSQEIRNITRPGKVTGQVIALLGPSGVGKTQLFRCMAGLQKPDTGRILLTNEKVPVRAGMVGVVPQNYILFDHRTVLGNLLIAAKKNGGTDADARTRAQGMLKHFHLEGRERAYPGELSGGQRQRVAIAQQLLCSGHYLLMDEPFSGLDPIVKKQVCTTINEVAQADDLNTIIVVTHDIESAVMIADTIWLVGRDWEEKEGKRVSRGARIQKTFNLIDLDLAWTPDIEQTQKFFDFARQIKSEFAYL